MVLVLERVKIESEEEENGKKKSHEQYYFKGNFEDKNVMINKNRCFH